MTPVSEILQNGSPFTYLAAMFGMLALVAALVALIVSGVVKRRTVAIAIAFLALLASVAPIAIGVVGYGIGVSRTEQAVAFADAEFADQLRARGHEEAFGSIIIGGACTSVPLLLALGALALAAMKRRASIAA